MALKDIIIYIVFLFRRVVYKFNSPNVEKHVEKVGDIGLPSGCTKIVRTQLNFCFRLSFVNKNLIKVWVDKLTVQISRNNFLQNRSTFIYQKSRAVKSTN